MVAGRSDVNGADEYEQFDAVRAMEMQEARDDYMFVSLHEDPEFVELTRLAGRHRM